MSNYTPRPEPLYNPETICREDYTIFEYYGGYHAIYTKILEYYKEKYKTETTLWGIAYSISIGDRETRFKTKTKEDVYKLIDEDIKYNIEQELKKQLVEIAIYDYNIGEWQGYNSENDYDLNYAPLKPNIKTLDIFVEWEKLDKGYKRITKTVILPTPKYRPGDIVIFTHFPNVSQKYKATIKTAMFTFNNALDYRSTKIGHGSEISEELIQGLY